MPTLLGAYDQGNPTSSLFDVRLLPSDRKQKEKEIVCTFEFLGGKQIQ